jgi:hypothetical protein
LIIEAMPARLFAICSSISAIGSLWLHLRHTGCPRRFSFTKANEAKRPSATPEHTTEVAFDAGSASGGALDCSQLLNDANDRDHFVSFGRTISQELEAIWSDLILQAPHGSLILDVGNLVDTSSLQISSILSSEKNLIVHSFRSMRSSQVEICESLSRHDGTDSPSRVHIYPVVVAEREGWRLPSHQPQISLDIFSSDQGWLGSSDDAPVANGRGFLRGSMAIKSRAPVIQLLTLHSTCTSSTNRVLQGAKELLNRHFVRNILVTSALDTGKGEEIESGLGMKVLLDAGYHPVKSTIDSSDAQRRQIDWWTLQTPR